MANEITIPLLPCHSIDEMVDFYRAIGFEVTYQQSKPNNYAVVQRGGIELHFFTMRDYIPANSYSTCYVRLTEIDALYADFCAGLKQKYGRVPSAGIPRVLPLKNKTGRREFIVVDPGGNWIRIGQILETAPDKQKPTGESTALSRAINAANLLEEAGDYPQAAQKLDAALALPDSFPTTQRVQALVQRSAIAINMNDFDSARTKLEQLRQIDLTDKERTELSDSLERADELATLLPEATN